jgi:cellulose synthase/poly-beta-1,6-N-acetylglucosamine synthase-like glycosyltransferase
VLTVLIQLLVLLVFTNRYFSGTLLKKIRGVRFDEVVDDYEPSVTVVIPMFNEGEDIVSTIETLAEQAYPDEKLSVIVVDDCSSDDSYLWACKAAGGYSNVTVLRNAHNLGKRRSINRAVLAADSEIIVSVDSDVVVKSDAVRQLVRRFVRPEIAAVGGRVNVINRNDNWLTRMQTIKYFYGYEYNKNLERSFRTVMCLSGSLTAYRRHVLLELHETLENRHLFGNPIRYGEDRYLSRQIVKAGYQTVLTLEAVCYTKVPAGLRQYFSQQLRWRRSNLADYLGGLSHVWKLHPVVAVHYFSTSALLLGYPAIVFHALITGHFWELALVHVGVGLAHGVIYRLQTSDLPPEERVGPLDYLGAVLVMPVTYLVLTPLALFTLDTGCWETRGHAHEPLGAPHPTGPLEGQQR